MNQKNPVSLVMNQINPITLVSWFVYLCWLFSKNKQKTHRVKDFVYKII